MWLPCRGSTFLQVPSVQPVGDEDRTNRGSALEGPVEPDTPAPSRGRCDYGPHSTIRREQKRIDECDVHSSLAGRLTAPSASYERYSLTISTYIRPQSYEGIRTT